MSIITIFAILAISYMIIAGFTSLLACYLLLRPTLQLRKTQVPNIPFEPLIYIIFYMSGLVYAVPLLTACILESTRIAFQLALYTSLFPKD